MKKTYSTPVAEKIEFRYRDQVAAESGTVCTQKWTGFGDSFGVGCSSETVVADSGL